ncbi:hypothetical protein [Crystallibacter degradans]|uniref:hypothetical protein n=1 Tax=Crystallibacter degradans TaxID=2726743 RepID=UPI0014762CC2|nr:hypothetical protein [Arthrobacter sp. SF27]NMR32288.1 hypothetical protein [Arthrobacter sp. SF27]
MLKELPVRSFVRAKELPGSPAAARNALFRAAKRGDVVRCSRGLYFKGPKTRYGMTRPGVLEVALEVLGAEGTGPAGYSAARAFGLTSQVPARVELAVISSLKQGIDGVKLYKRNNARRHGLSFLEIALLEVLREPATVESGWDSLIIAVRNAVKSGDVYLGRVAEAVPEESSPAVRRRFEWLAEAIAA